MQKPARLIWVSSLPSGELEWHKLTPAFYEAPIYGKLVFETELLVLMVFPADEATYRKVEQSAEDAIIAVAHEASDPA